MDAFIDHYLILGLPSGEEAFKISMLDITKAYRLKALEIHPDKRRDDPNAVVGFQKLQASYEILKNDHTRKVFDASLSIRILQQKGRERRSDVEDKTTRMMSEHAEEIRLWRTMIDRQERNMRKSMDDLEGRNGIRRMPVMKNKKGKRMGLHVNQNTRSASFARMMKDVMRF